MIVMEDMNAGTGDESVDDVVSKWVHQGRRLFGRHLYETKLIYSYS